MNTMNKIPKMLRELIEQKGKTSVKLVAKAIGVDHGSLYRALKEGGNPEGKTIEKILDYLGYEIRFIKYKRKEVNLIRQSRSKRRKEVS